MHSVGAYQIEFWSSTAVKSRVEEEKSATERSAL